MRIAPILAIALIAPACAADGDQELTEICQRICGTWEPAELDAGGPAMHWRIVFDKASGEIRGTKSVDGWDGGGAASVDVVIAYIPETGTVRMVEGDLRVGALVSTAYIDPETIVFSGLVPGKPDLSAITQFKNPTPDTLYELHAESGQQYNSLGFEQTYKRVKK